MDFTDAHRQALLCLRLLARQHKTATEPAIRDSARAAAGSTTDDWGGVLAELRQACLAKIDSDVYLLTEAGIREAERLHRRFPLGAYLYREIHRRAPRSAAYDRLCVRVFGRNLCQQGQADMAQLDALLDALDIRAEHRVLDVGCGNGLMTAYIADRTGADVLGIDLSAEGIAFAKEHAAAKTGRVTFEVANVNDLDLSCNAFDRIVSIDTLHLAADLKRTLAGLAEILAPGGRMGVFWESWINPEKWSRDLLRPPGTRLGRTLAELDWPFETTDFSEHNDALWAEMKRVLSELRTAFESEGNSLLYDVALSQTRRTEWGVGSRFLYDIRPCA